MTDVDTGIRNLPAADAFAVSPELAADAFRRLSQLQDVVGQLIRQAKVLGRSVPLGEGYAGQVGEFMARYGLGDGADSPDSVVRALTRFGRELEELKLGISEALRRYEEQDSAAADGVDCRGGG